MDASSHDKPLSQSKECVLNNSENDVFRLGTEPFVTPQKHVADATPNLCTPDTFKSPLDFTTVTVEQLGITPESFVKTSSGKSPSSLQKARRRSTVGVRGSPETNCLIRFIAQQRNLKKAVLSPLAREPHFEGSPRLYRNASVLRERMSAFRSAFHSIQETKKMASSPSAAEADGESRISDLTRKEDLEYQQSGFPVNSSSKRRRISSQDSPDNYLSGTKALADEACAGGASTDLAEKSPDIGSAQSGCMAAPLPELRETSQGLAVTDCIEGTRSVDALPLDIPVTPLSSGTATATRSPETPMCGSSSRSAKTFVLRSVLKKPSKLFSENGKEFNLCDDGAHLIPCPSNSCKEGRAGRENCKTPGCLNPRKRKRVTFGEDLSPEVFDESLPANTPLCKGGTPVRPRTVKTTSPQQSPVHEQFLQPNFDDKEENLENIEPPQGSFANLSLSKSSLSEIPPGTNTCSSLNKDEEIICSIVRPTRTSQRKKQMLSSTGVCSSYTTQAEPRKEKMSRRKSREKKHTSAALPKMKQVLKSYRKKKKGKKDVEKCLYGPRDIASKKPLLSPIPELPEVSEATPLADCTQGTSSDDFNKCGQLEEVNSFEIPTQRKRRLPQKADPPELDPAHHQSRVSDKCCYLLPLTTASERGPNASTRDTGSEGNTRAESKCQSAKEPKPGSKMESGLVPWASVTQDHIVSKNPEPLGSPQSLFKAGQNLENPCEILIVSESMNLKCEKESECLAPQGSLQGSPVSTDSKRDLNCSEDVLIQNIKEPASHSENVGTKCAGNGSPGSGRERKWRRRTVCCGGQSSYLEQNGNPVSSCSGESFVEISLESMQLIEELSNTIEQSFQRTSSKTKVRRSTRLQRDLENTGLVWLSPSPSTLQKPRRRMTICTLDSRGFECTSSKEETISSGQNPGHLPAVSGSESQGVGSSVLPRKRRSLCGSTLTDANSATQPPDCKRKPSLKGESSQLP